MVRVLASAGKDLKGSVFLEALAEREEANRSGKMTVSVVIVYPCNVIVTIEVCCHYHQCMASVMSLLLYRTKQITYIQCTIQ